MPIPKYHETFIPILKVLSNGQMVHYDELRKRVRDQHFSDLSREELELKTKSGDPVVLNRIGWGKVYLKQAGLIDQPQRGMVRITRKGTEALENGTYTLQDILKDPVFLAHREAQAAKSAESESAEDENATPEDLIERGIRGFEGSVKADLLDRLRAIDPYYFQNVVLELLKKMGYGDFIETPRSGDGGIDGIVYQDQLGLEKIYIQAKRYTDSKVREPEIRNFIGAMSGDTPKGIFVTTSTYDEKAVAKARDANHTIVLIDGNKLVDLLYRYNVGVQMKSTFELKQIDADFFGGN